MFIEPNTCCTIYTGSKSAGDYTPPPPTKERDTSAFDSFFNDTNNTFSARGLSIGLKGLNRYMVYMMIH
jgi:hypothetical protein